jgi:flavodoxin
MLPGECSLAPLASHQLGGEEMYEVMYFSRGGNTRKLATAIAGELGVKAQHVRSVQSLPEGVDVFLGSGLYFMRPSRLVLDFIRKNDFQGKRVALFGTSASGIGVETFWMERLLKRQGAIITGKWYCPGQFSCRFAGKSFVLMRKGRPGDKDLEKAKSFARSIRDASCVGSSLGGVPQVAARALAQPGK